MFKGKNRKNKIGLLVMVGLCVISMLGQVLIQSNFGKTKVDRYITSTEDLANTIRENNEKYGKEVDVTFEGMAHTNYSMLVFKPRNATEENPVPAVVCIHGGYNSGEKQFMNYIELSRRGFAVIVPDLANANFTDAEVAGQAAASGASVAVEYAMSLPYVDETRIGVADHSYGSREGANVIAHEHANSEHNNITAFFLGASVSYYTLLGDVGTDVIDDLFLGVCCAQYDEWDILSDGATDHMVSDSAKLLVSYYNPEYAAATERFTEGSWISSDGTVQAYDPDAVQGVALGNVANGVAIWNPAIPHNLAFCKSATSEMVTTFYAAFGVPEGAEYISPSNQTNQWYTFFQVLGLIGFVGMMFPLISLLLELKIFKPLEREKIAVTAELPSIKKAENWIPALLVFIATVVYGFYRWPTDFVNGYLDAFNGYVYTFERVNSVTYFFLDMAVFGLVCTIIVYLFKRFLHRKDGVEVPNPYRHLQIHFASELPRACLMAITVVVIMFIPVYIGYFVFHTTFRMYEMTVFPDTLSHYYLFFSTYFPALVIMLMPGVAGNINFRYKELPDWLTALIAGLQSSLSVWIFTIMFYGSVIKNGAYKWPDGYVVMAGMAGCTSGPVILFAAFMIRYAYKKTKNPWVPVFLNAIFLGLIFFTASNDAGLQTSIW